MCQSLSITNIFSNKNPASSKVGKDRSEGLKKRQPDFVTLKQKPLSSDEYPDPKQIL